MVSIRRMGFLGAVFLIFLLLVEEAIYRSIHLLIRSICRSIFWADQYADPWSICRDQQIHDKYTLVFHMNKFIYLIFIYLQCLKVYWLKFRNLTLLSFADPSVDLINTGPSEHLTADPIDLTSDICWLNSQFIYWFFFCYIFILIFTMIDIWLLIFDNIYCLSNI